MTLEIQSENEKQPKKADLREDKIKFNWGTQSSIVREQATVYNVPLPNYKYKSDSKDTTTSI